MSYYDNDAADKSTYLDEAHRPIALLPEAKPLETRLLTEQLAKALLQVVLAHAKGRW